MSEVERTLREAELPSFELGRSPLKHKVCCLKGERTLREAELPSFGLGVFSSEAERSSLELKRSRSRQEDYCL